MPVRTIERQRLRSVHVVPVTAFGAEGRLDLAVQAEHTRRLVRAGATVLMPAAGTGEFHSLTADEAVRVVEATRQAAGPDVLVFAAVGYQLDHAVAIGRGARDASADGIMFMPPGHPYLCDAGLREYYLEVLKQVGLPALIYKRGAFPSDALLLELAGHPLVVGVKYAENNLPEFRRTVLADKDRIEWLCGSAERFAPYFMLAGATGYTSGVANVAAEATLAMHAALAVGDFAEGMKRQSALLPFEELRARAGESYNISVVKHAVTACGIACGPARPPQRPLTDADRAEIEALLPGLAIPRKTPPAHLHRPAAEAVQASGSEASRR